MMARVGQMSDCFPRPPLTHTTPSRPLRLTPGLTLAFALASG